MGVPPGRRRRGPGFFPFLEKEPAQAARASSPSQLSGAVQWGRGGRLPSAEGCSSERPMLQPSSDSRAAASRAPAGRLRLCPGLPLPWSPTRWPAAPDSPTPPHLPVYSQTSWAHPVQGYQQSWGGQSRRPAVAEPRESRPQASSLVKGPEGSHTAVCGPCVPLSPHF